MVKVDVFGIVWWPCQKNSSAKVPGKKRDFGRITRFWIIAKVNFAYVFENYALSVCPKHVFCIRVRELRVSSLSTMLILDTCSRNTIVFDARLSGRKRTCVDQIPPVWKS